MKYHIYVILGNDKRCVVDHYTTTACRVNADGDVIGEGGALVNADGELVGE